MVLFRAFACFAFALLSATAAHAAAAHRHGPAPARRIVALEPSFTEDLFAIGAGARVVGVSTYSDYPPAAARLPIVATYASVDAERVVALHADAVIGIPSRARQVEALRRAGVRTVLVADDGYDDIFRDVRAAGALSGRDAAAEALIARLRARTAALVRRAAHRARRPAVLVVLGDAPIYTIGDRSYLAALIRLAGGRNAASGLLPAYGQYSAEAVVAAQPDVLIVDRDAHLDLRRAPWNALRAVREHRVYTAQSEALYRPGPRYNDGLAWLIGILDRA